MKYFNLERKQLSTDGNGKYNYCPYCIKDIKKLTPDKDYKEVMKPIIYNKVLCVDDEHFKENGDNVKWIEEFWECPRCRKKLTDEDYVLHYVKKDEGVRK